MGRSKLMTILFITGIVLSVSANTNGPSSPPDLTNWLTTPNGNEVYTVGQTIALTINSAVYRPPVITVALYKGTTLIQQSASSSITGRTISTTGLAKGSDYRVRIYNTNAATEEDWSNAYFTIGPIPDLSNWLTSPNGGQTFVAGQSLSVSINGSLYAPSTIAIELYKGTEKVYGASYGGATNRSVPTTASMSGSDYKIRIYNPSKPTEEDWSNASFTIETPNLSNWLLSPNGTEIYAVGTPVPVSINSAVYAPPSVSVELYKGSSLVYGPVAGSATGRTIPTAGLVPGSDYKVRIFNTENPALEDISWQPFIIGASGPPADLSAWLRTPNGGEDFVIGNSIPIVIEAVKYFPGVVAIELYKGAAKVYSGGLSGSDRTNIPTAGLAQGSDYKIRIFDLNNSTFQDWSDMPFTIGLTGWLQSPNGGEAFTVGANIPLTINSALHNPSSISVELYKGATRVYGPITGGAQGRLIPTTNLGSGTDYKIRIFNTAAPSEEDWSNNSFTLNAPNITNWLLSPNGNEVYTVGQSINVSIDATLYAPFLITVSLYKGATLITSSTSPGTTGRTISTTGLKVGSDYKVKIQNANVPTEEDWSNASFTIGPIPNLSNWLISPNGGQTFMAGQTLSVSINESLYSSSTIAIELYNGAQKVYGASYGGATNRSIPTSTSMSGSDYKIRIYNPDKPTEEDWSNSSFTIQTPDVGNWLLSPNGTEVYAVGTPIPISINSSVYAPPSVSVELYKGSARVYGPVAGNVTGRTIPTAGLVPGSDYKVRIFNTENPSFEDASWQPFIIGASSPPADLSTWLRTPDGGEEFVVGNSIPIIIEAVKYFPHVIAIELYKGATKVHSGGFSGSDRTTISTVGLPPGNDYKIRIFDLDNHSKEDWSDNTFTIFPANLDSWLNPLPSNSFKRGTLLAVGINAGIYNPPSVSIEVYKDNVLILGPLSGPLTGRSVLLKSMGLGSGYKLKIFDTAVPVFEDWSDEEFSITAEDLNYVRSVDVLVDGIKNDTDISNSTTGKKVENYVFYDGLGRPMQSLIKNGSPTGNDIIQPIVYDGLGREQRKYLPFTVNAGGWFVPIDEIVDAAGAYKGVAAEFYNTPGSTIATDTKPYAETRFETSPLNRVVKQGAPGNAWQPDNNNSYSSGDHTIKSAYETNNSSEVLLFSHTSPDATNVLGSVKLNFRSYYAPDELYKNKTKDEHGSEIIEFNDKEGRAILKKVQLDATTYAQTYYVYDDLGNLVSVIQPEGVKSIVNKLATIPWMAVTGMSVDAAFNLTKLNSSGYGNNGAISLEALGAGQDGWVEMTAQETDKSRMIGLAASNINHGTNIQYALELRNDGHIYVWESNAAGVDLGTYTMGTTVRVAREGTEIKYYVNGIHKQTTSGVGNESLLIDMAINHAGGTIKNVNFSFAVTSILQQVLNNFTFRYTYDGRKRMTQKLVPGTAVTYMIYDDRDRLVLMQDGNLRKNTSGTDLKQWVFTKYEALNRAVATGIYTADVVLTQSGMQDLVDQYYDMLATNNGTWSESFSIASGNVHGYDNRSFPVVSDPEKYLSVTYYDDYLFKTLFNSAAFDFHSAELPADDFAPGQDMSEAIYVKGQITGTKTKLLNAASWLKGVNYYDEQYRLIQRIEENPKGHEVTTHVYDFIGKALRTKTSLYTGQPVQWTNLVNAQVQEDVLIATTTSSWGSGAASVQSLPSQTDGWVESTVIQNSPVYMMGLSDVNVNANYNTIDYAIYVAGTSLRVYENGSSKFTTGVVFPGDVVRVERIGDKVHYKRNGLVFYTSATTSSTSLVVDVALNTVGARIANAKISNTFSVIVPYLAVSSFTKEFKYDNGGRLLETWHQTGHQQSSLLLVKNSYNELSQLIDKGLHSNDGITFRQSVDFRYTIRGWLSSINNAELMNATNDESSDFFGMNLAYNDDLGTGNANSDPSLDLRQYNGNISAIRWSKDLGLGEFKQLAYNFKYNRLNQLEKASSLKLASSSAWTSGEYDENGLTYDLNGNIQTLKRTGEGGIAIDDLSYSYGSGAGLSNKLLSVTDNVSDGEDKLKGLRDGNTSGNDYAYDANGNMLLDKNKGVTTNILFNHLNLPSKVTRNNSSVNYIYDAAGRKFGQVVVSGGSHQVTEYVGAWVFENNVLEYLQHDEGRVVLSERKLIYHTDGDDALAFTPTANSSVALQQVNGIPYVRIAPVVGTALTDRGVLAIGGVFPVTAGQRYIYRVKGYGNSALPVSLVVKGNGNELISGATLLTSAINEAWVESTFIIPPGITDMTLGLVYKSGASAVAADHAFVKAMELYRVTATAPEYQYQLKDHLGNVRVTFTTKDEVESKTVTLEPAQASDERAVFLHYDEAVIVNHEIFDHTNDLVPAGTTNATRLLGGNTNSVYGLTRSLSVMPGDQISMEVYAKYLDPQSANWDGPFEDFLTQFTSQNPPAGSIIDGGAAGSIGGGIFPYADLILKDGVSETAPKAFLNWIVFDRDFNPIVGESGFVQIGTNARENGTNVDHRLLARATPLLIREPGYVYIYISNENETEVEVYFDDFKVEHVKSPILQTNDYYPFGLTASSSQRENSIADALMYNGKEVQDELNLGWLDYGARMYMPEIGRWGAVDPLAEKYFMLSPYTYVANSPAILTDPDGREISFTAEYDEHGNLIGVTLTVTGKVIDNSSKKYSAKQMERKKGQIEKGLAGMKIENSAGISFNVVGDIQVANSESEIKHSDHVFRLVDEIEKVPGADKPAPGSDAKGYAPLGEKVMYLEKGFGSNLIAHEFGHSAGLKHIDETSAADLNPTKADFLRFNASPNSNLSGCECALQEWIKMRSTFYTSNDFKGNLMHRGVVRDSNGQYMNNSNKGNKVTRAQVESILYKIRNKSGINGFLQK